jgi:hypothetical protein
MSWLEKISTFRFQGTADIAVQAARRASVENDP